MLNIIFKIVNFSSMIIYWQILSLYYIISTQFFGVKDDYFHFAITSYNIRFTGDTYEKINKTTKVVLMNHASFADFFIDNYILDCKGCYLSRYLVCLVIPLNALYCIITRQAYYFNRNNIKHQIGDIIDTVCNQWEKIAILYPEGTRNTTKKVIPLKYGAIKQIYLRNLPLQIMNISNKDKVINEKQLNVNYGVVCNVIITEQIDPSKFETFDAFIEEITKKWIENFQ
jgi:1-acyl-sn-glycerol-3-phosphate acyltransferase